MFTVCWHSGENQKLDEITQKTPEGVICILYKYMAGTATGAGSGFGQRPLTLADINRGYRLTACNAVRCVQYLQLQGITAFDKGLRPSK